MEAELVMTVEEMKDREKWLEMRRQGIGGTDISAILGMSNWKTPFAVWEEKVHAVRAAEIEDEKRKKTRLKAGRFLEQLVAEMFEDETGKKVKKCGLLRSKERPFMLASVDRLIIGEEAGLECKTADNWYAAEWASDKLPDTYYLQCQWYMAVTGFKTWYIACLIGFHTFVWKEIPRNDDDIKAMVEAAAEFWQKNIVEKALPTVDSTQSCTAAINRIFPANGESEEFMMLDAAQDLLVEDIKKLDADIKAIQLAKTEKENQLRVILGDATKALASRYKILYPLSTRVTFDAKRLGEESKALLDAYGDEGLKEKWLELYEDCKKATQSRALRIKLLKGNEQEEE